MDGLYFRVSTDRQNHGGRPPLQQVNAVVPQNVSSGSAVPVILRVGFANSQVDLVLVVN
jgi:uncharacterized protein (TIGR03437 family)